ncbi:23S rRNA (cytidine(2498)-2'-O)-methyltransferase RlmM [Salinimonas sediminis]|uniref:Ribosomal RNA large subunit methyltransferase M n=1 Tax=Salinimonas sediminis TaxID=2303538 RepID=A0A346NKS0_9ALTE|nr:23S rRNA (cytidine(2498)-2'-O)-methyltransferase RlmM [Salinimonas sediminis]AXR06127.1 23S rRNA (cytidine(2498)-2'-O)-methyltransferase RlmM [Salinimonas sediminis]
MASLLGYCRAGYEADLANELSARAAQLQCYGYPKFVRGQGYVEFDCYNPADADKLGQRLAVADTVFARQLVVVTSTLDDLPREDRLSPVLQEIIDHDDSAMVNGLLLVEHADTDEGKELAKFCRKFAVVLRQGLRKGNCLTYKEKPQGRGVHVFFTQFDRCLVGYSYPDCRSAYANGIYRLKFPSAAPSRSTLKLEEAILTMLTPAQQQQVFREGGRAVDLGACPGGWTYQLVHRQMYVEAIDNGLIDEKLMASGLVEHFAADGFTYRPQFGRVDLLVCDMIEQPDRVARLMGDWLVNRWAEHAIFNLKLPMKKRYETVTQAMADLTARLQKLDDSFVIRLRHLYHDRDEITVSILRE